METIKFEETIATTGIVDKALGTITGVSLISTPEAKGHNLSLDEASIQSFYDAVEGKTVKAYYTHSPENEALDSIGLWTDFEVVKDGEYTKLTAKFEALESWREHHKDEFDSLFELADKAPEAFGVSAEFQAEIIYYNEEGEATNFDGQENVEKFARAVSVSAFSIVAQPAANPTGLFSEKKEEINFEEVSEKLIKLQEENDGLVVDLKLSKDLNESLEKSCNEKDLEISNLQEELKNLKSKFANFVSESGSNPVEAATETKPLSFEEQLAACNSWKEKQDLINQNMSALVRTWNQ